MINVIYKTSDGKEYQKKEDAIYHETYYQRSAYEGALADYHYFRFNDHRDNVKYYLMYKHISLEDFMKLSAYKLYSRTQARKKLWALRIEYKCKVEEGVRKIAQKKAALQNCIAKIKQEEKQMKEM